MDRKGLSEVVTTLIIILLVLVAIGIVWVVVSNILSSGTQQIGLEQFSIDINFVKASINGNVVTLTVKRAAGAGNVTGVKFIISDGSNSEEFTKTGNINELDTKTFTVTTTLNPVDIKSASVVPIFVRNGEDTFGDLTDTYTFAGGSSGNGVPVCGNAACESGETEMSCPADCISGGAVCGNSQCESGETTMNCPSDCGIGACVPACTGSNTCVNGICVPPGCTESRTDAQVCSDAGAVCGTVQNICGEFVSCDAPVGGCTVLQQCIANQCQALVFIPGTVYSVWPTGVAIYLDSEDLPTDNIYSGYYAKFLAPSQESECLLVDDYILPQPPQQTRVIIKLQATQTSVAAGDSVRLWPTFASCSA